MAPGGHLPLPIIVQIPYLPFLIRILDHQKISIIIQNTGLEYHLSKIALWAARSSDGVLSGAAAEVVAPDNSNLEAASGSMESDVGTSITASNNEHIILLNTGVGAASKFV
ncbi:hypothetical protein RAB80_013996 [Fusarium oxysporum f. sp. vasinfectum]|nr:hypothetical protein RAB80_013996 [Fusarium oxysporum f. sp. vasinfectum]KAK2923106.1 hypothetical protein FoTM2_016628 [Fusarium oxysporum f. sp. vasinfectum]